MIVHEAPKDYRGLAKTSWILLFLACLVALIPFVGFAAWFIAGPIFLTTFILAVMILTRGGTGQGILIMLFSMFVAPVVVVCGPFISSFIASVAGLAGVGAVAEHAEKEQQRNAPKVEAPATPAVVGDLTNLVARPNKFSDPIRLSGRPFNIKSSGTLRIRVNGPQGQIYDIVNNEALWLLDSQGKHVQKLTSFPSGSRDMEFLSMDGDNKTVRVTQQ